MPIKFSTWPQTSVDMTQQPQIDSPQCFALCRRDKVEDLTGLCRTALYDAMREGLFPSQVKIGIRSVAWRQVDVIEWVNARIAGQTDDQIRVMVQKMKAAHLTLMRCQK